MKSSKTTERMSRPELELRELYELLGEVKNELKEIRAISNDLYIKAQISHSLIVVRKVSENRIKALNQLLD